MPARKFKPRPPTPPPLEKPADVYRVLHTADWHLGKTLGDLSRVEEHTRFLDQLLTWIRDYQVDALLVAGDVFDSANSPQSAVAQYYQFIARLHAETSCAMVVTGGNHDSPAHLNAPREVLASLRVHVTGSWPDDAAEAVVVLPSPENPRLVVAAVPFLRDRDLRSGQTGQTAAEIQQDLLAGIRKCYATMAEEVKPWRAKGAAAVAMGHLTVSGGEATDSEREIHVGGLGAVTTDVFPDVFSYVALGHLHRPQICGGKRTVRYSGSPIPLSFSEAEDLKEVRVLDFRGPALAKQYGLAIPLTRPLVQWRLGRGELEFGILLDPLPQAELDPWVEVIVEDPRPGENLTEKICDLMDGRKGAVIRVMVRQTAASSLSLEAEAGSAEAADLLGRPADVFARLLDQQTLEPDERAKLETAFQELLTLHAEQAAAESSPEDVPA